MKKIILVTSIIALSLLSIFYIYKYTQNNVIKIAFVGGLSGKYSYLGHNVLNGLVLALEEVDYKVGDKRVELIQRDDKQNKNEAKKIIEEFVKKDIKVVIGNTTSSMTEVSIPLVNKEKDMLLISPTASSDAFSDKDDNFIRTQVSFSSKVFNDTTRFLLEKGLKKAYVIYDKNNFAYTNTFMNKMEESFLDNGGEKYVGKKSIDNSFEDILKDMNTKEIDMLVVVASSLDSAKFIQYFRLNKKKMPIVCAGWAKTKNFLVDGGSAVEGTIFTSGYDDNSKSPEYLKFVKKYEKRYQNSPSIFSVQAYETMKIILEKLELDDEGSLKERILNQGIYQGLQGDIVFNEFGDVYRNYFLMRVENGEYRRISQEELLR